MNEIYTLSEDKKTLIRINDENITEFSIPEGVTRIESSYFGGAFGGCTSLQSIDIPNSVTEIGSEAFSGCTSLQSIDIPNSVTEIGASAFEGCTSLQSIDIPNSVTKIGGYTFKGCSSLQSIDIPNSVTIIWGAFKGCTSLQSIDIPNSVTIIWGAFEGCTSLQSIDIPNSVTKIGGRAFDGCSSLQSIFVAKDNTSFQLVDGVLYNINLTKIIRVPQNCPMSSFAIPNSVTEIGCSAFEGCTSLQSIDIPNSVTEIGDWAFEGCTSLQSIDIPNSVTEIGVSAFGGCSSLQSIFVAKDNTLLKSVDGVLYNINLTKIIRVPQNCQMSSFTIPNSVTEIWESAFFGCTSLQNIDIPNSVTEIGGNAFSDCSSLKDLFMKCEDLDKVDVSVSSFDSVSFDDCILHVPSGTRWAYRHHPVFSKFKNIVTEKYE